jgi:hypothetical protein
MEPIDNTEMLAKIHEVQAIADLMLTRLDENADTEAKKLTAVRIRTVVELQQMIIRGLVEQHLTISDRLEELLAKTQK